MKKKENKVICNQYFGYNIFKYKKFVNIHMYQNVITNLANIREKEKESGI